MEFKIILINNIKTKTMKTEEKIKIWNELPAQEKMAMGDHYITHESNLSVWNMPYIELSPLKQKRVLQSIEEFSKIKFHGIIGSGICGFRESFRVSISDKELMDKLRKEKEITQHSFSTIGRDALIFFFKNKK
jgi:hypothetical protein